VTRPSPQVRTVLEITNLADMLIEAGEPVAEVPAGPIDGTRVEHDGAVFHIFDVAPAAEIRCRVIGTEAPLAASAFSAEHCSSLRLPESGFAFGIGAIGEGFADCRDRFGEFVAIGHAAAYQPADGTSVPDYLVGSGAQASELQLPHALRIKPGHVGRITVPDTTPDETWAAMEGVVADWPDLFLPRPAD